MSPPRVLGWVAASSLVATACATTVQVPEIPILDGPAFKAARREPEPKERVQVVEVPKPLPLPGQLKPVPEKVDKAKDDKQPKERVAEANALAKIEPAKDGYINAIQVYPYTRAPSTSSTPPSIRSPTSRSSPARSWSRSPQETRCAGSSAIPPAARARRRRFISW